MFKKNFFDKRIQKEFQKFIKIKIEDGEMFLSIDLKPPFDDTPDNYEQDLENLFIGKY